MQDFGVRLSELRKESDISQEELAKKIGTSRSCIGNYEQGTRKPDYESLEKLADYFNVDMAYLLGKQEQKKLIDLKELANRTYWNIKLNEIIMDFNDEQMEKLCDYAELLALKK